jgi:7,8-dihydroneopterin aldolase/epimerase/oxygenase
MGIYKVRLRDVVFIAAHGLYEEERVLKNQFLVSTELQVNIDSVDQAKSHYIDYAKVYDLLLEVMSSTTGTLEELAANILNLYGTSFKQISQAEVTICKQNPLMGKQVPAAEVSLSKAY